MKKLMEDSTIPSVVKMLKIDAFLKQELKRMFIWQFRRQTILIGFCTMSIISFLYWNNAYTSEQDIKILKELRANRVVLTKEREDMQIKIDSFNKLIKQWKEAQSGK